jgi:biopolymer transport protein ExbD
LRPAPAVVAALVLSGVGSTAVAGPDAGAAAACEKKVATLAHWIADAPREPSSVVVSEDLRLVERDLPGLGGEQFQSPTIEVRAHGSPFWFWYHTYRDAEGLGGALNEFQSDRQKDKPAGRLIVAADRDAPWSYVAAAVAAAGAAGFYPIELAFERASHLAAPPPALAAETQRISSIEDPFDRQRHVALLFNALAEPCPPATKVLNSLGGVHPHEKIGILIAELPPALRACQCATDPGDMMQAAWMFLQPSPDGIVRRTFLGARIKVAPPGAPAAVVRAKKNVPWSKVYGAVLDAAKPGAEPTSVRFEVATQPR